MLKNSMDYGSCNLVIQRGCPIEETLMSLGGKWKGIIINTLYDEAYFYNALHREVLGISRKILTEQLNDLIALQIVKREETNDYPKKVRYSLTQRGKSVYPLINELAQVLKMN
ncbi:HxlR family transcriptional regulator [Staphylococcus saprophyticus]|uniref:winged helix-turn-helix transcriptional regulator n=1 Tax=Staphylococcus TaxID=1279 RepID=UPI0006484948|nr:MULTISPECIES: helix-turn-helix domain-containing protein [Staphylococcus]CRV28156.1 transcriptional regulator protein [Streptococcus equi subsp. equi]AMG32352.1 transcriptional regulator [Staphylococcus saprophyticus]ASE58273.1 transcriptional regulator [Staphylococcus saprophyticus]MBM0843776.1 transcriptional regulator [Staphylococcus saprophyticus]MBN6851605.1 helix-turn-helix transcriptional regulator [Staphylococcus saprophyticus]